MDSPSAFWAALLVVGYALGARYLEHSVVTAPMAMVLAGAILGPSGLGLADISRGANAQREALLELALALQLFNAGAELHFRRQERHWAPALRLIVIALPLGIVLATCLGFLLFPGLRFSEALLLAAVLAPGDGDLIRPFLESPDVPRKVTGTLKLENALSDSVVVTFFALAMSLTGGVAFHPRGQWLLYLGRQLGFGFAVGAIIGLGAAKLLELHTVRGRFAAETMPLAITGVAVLAYTAAYQVDGSPLVGASVAGLVLGNHAGMSDEALAFCRSAGLVVSQLTYALLGALAVGPALKYLSWKSVAYTALLVPVGRLVPVGLSLWRAKMSRPAVLSIAWFSPRGLPSVLLAVLFLQRSPVANARALIGIATVTIMASIFLHGASAEPAARVWRRRREGARERPAEASR
jgi:NhaP-type Na+/H+ or K+/H+ antiporter